MRTRARARPRCCSRGTAPEGRGERGAATAELAMVLPLLVAVTAGLVWLLAVGAAQVRTVDAARETARALARGDDQGAAVDRGLQVAPDGSTVTVTRTDGQVHVSVTGRLEGPGGLFAHLPAPHLRAEAVALDEATSGTGMVVP